jgi:lysophospholipase L1-like esterase
LLIGDSFTFGVGSAYHDTWAARQAKILWARGCAAEVTNAGVPGYDTRQEALLLGKWIAEIDPNVVIMSFLPNDLFAGSSDAAAAPSSAASGVVDTRGDKRSELEVVTLLKRLLLRSDAAYLWLYQMSARGDYFTTPLRPGPRRRLEQAQAALKEAAIICEQNGARFIVASLPQLFQVIWQARGEQVEGVDPEVFDRELGEFAKRGGMGWVPLLDALANAYRESGEDIYYRLDGHLTPRGNGIVAEALAESVSRDCESDGARP